MYRYLSLLSVVLFPGVLQAEQSMADFTMPKPPGPHCPVSAEQLKEVQSYRADQPLVGTHFFYWYDIKSNAHFVNYDGSDALTDHPAHSEGYSYKSAAWWKRELLDVMAAEIDFILPVYWGCPGNYDSWSFVGLPPLVQAWEELVREGKRPPRVGLFYDTSTLRHNPRGWHDHEELRRRADGLLRGRRSQILAHEAEQNPYWDTTHKTSRDAGGCWVDYATVHYWYQDQPGGFKHKPLRPVAERTQDLLHSNKTTP
jgi:hypothetical protein